MSDPHPIDAFYIIANENIETFFQEILEIKMRIIETAVEGIESSRDDGNAATQLIKRLKDSMWRKA